PSNSPRANTWVIRPVTHSSQEPPTNPPCRCWRPYPPAGSRAPSANRSSLAVSPASQLWTPKGRRYTRSAPNWRSVPGGCSRGAEHLVHRHPVQVPLLDQVDDLAEQAERRRVVGVPDQDRPGLEVLARLR